MTDINQAVLPGPDQWHFIDELRKKEPRYFAWTRTEPRENEVDFRSGVTLFCEFPDPAGLLETAFADFREFMREASLPESGALPLYLLQGEAGPYDSFRIELTRDRISIIAGDREGIRRGIFYLEDLLLASDGPFLPEEKIHRKAWLKNRISRCFFGPIKRPPFNRDELMDEVDYYPEEYLNRLAHEGINGLWLTVELKDLARTSFTPDAAPDSEKRLAKLQRTVDKCLRYGIRTFLFMIEPIAWKKSDVVLQKYPELGGAVSPGGAVCFCPSSGISQQYLYESAYYIFSRVSGLGGILNISIGEKTTTCLSSMPWSRKTDMVPFKMTCPRCSKEPLFRAVYKSVTALTKGMRDAQPDAEFISWYYCSNKADMREEFFELTKLPEGATLLFNFESGGRMEQCGREMVGGDYWLSYTGPSERFVRLMDAIPEGTGRGAKLQVGCSHECATVPYVPVPGLLYRKYKEMKKLNVTTVMQCWYFGNYPGLMNKAAGMLAFEEFQDTEEDFLRRLAAPLWGKNAQEFTKIWQMTSDAYQNYPFSNMVQYMGPFHDALVWPLYPECVFLPMRPTWRADYPVSGDLIGECLQDLPLENAEILSRNLAELWHKAAEKALAFREEYRNSPSHLADLDLLEALDLLFRSAHHIFRFYQLRGMDQGFTEEMRSIVKEEISLSRRMKVLCEKDSRLGFHSEAENYRFYPEKLELRARFLEETLSSPVKAVEEEALPIREEALFESEGFSFRVAENSEGLRLNIHFHQTHRVDQIFCAIQGRAEVPPTVIGVTKENGPIMIPEGASYQAQIKEDGSWEASFMIPWKHISLWKGTFRLSLVRYMVPEDDIEFEHYPPAGEKVHLRLGIGYHLPQYALTFRPSRMR